MSLHDLKNIIGKTAKAVFDNEKFPVGVLAIRARRAAQAYPTDSTLVAMSNFLNRRAESNNVLITRAELREIYNKLYQANNKFVEVFAEELGTSEMVTKRASISRDPKEGTNLIENAFAKMADPILANALSSIFEENPVACRLYSKDNAKQAARTCLHELNTMSPPRKVDVVAGQQDLLICKATYDTPRGDAVALIPIEMKDNLALLPTVFLSQAGLMDLSKENIQQHIVTTAGKSFRVDAQKFLEIVSAAKNGPKKTLSEIDVILAKTAAAKGQFTTHTVDGVLYQEVDPKQVEVVVERTAESHEFGKKLSSSAGAAELFFGKSVVDAGRKMITTAMKNFGFKHANVAVTDANQNNLFFAVSVDNTAAFKVPMKVVRNNVQYPSFAMAMGSIYDFSSVGINNIFKADQVDAKMMTAASPSYNLKSSELVKNVKEAMMEGNLAKAEDSITVLQQSGDTASYKIAFNMYLGGLNKTASVTEDPSTCSMQRKVAHSKYLICGHTNLPIHKVYQDKRGDCQPLYRKDIAEAEGGSFLHSKIYMG